MASHAEGTAEEIWKQTNGGVDAFVSGAGTGGTIAGVGKFLKGVKEGVEIVLADPQGSGLFHKVRLVSQGARRTRLMVLRRSTMGSCIPRRRKRASDDGTRWILCVLPPLSLLPLIPRTGRRRNRTQPPHAQLLPSPPHHRRCHPVRPFHYPMSLDLQNERRVTDAEAVAMSRHLAQTDGLFLGSSSAVNLVACVRLAKKWGPQKGKMIVTILW